MRQIALLVYLLCGFSLVMKAQISGVVYKDFNSDGIKSASETTGVPNIKVYLFSNTGTLMDSTLTSATGAYSFASATAALGKLKVQFSKSSIPSYMQESFSGTNNGTDVQFVTAPISGVNLGVKEMGEYCQADPTILTKIYINGATSDPRQC